MGGLYGGSSLGDLNRDRARFKLGFNAAMLLMEAAFVLGWIAVAMTVYEHDVDRCSSYAFWTAALYLLLLALLFIAGTVGVFLARYHLSQIREAWRFLHDRRSD